MNNPKDTQQAGIAVNAASMGDSTPPAPQAGYLPPYPMTPPGFQPIYPQSNPQDAGGESAHPVAAPVGFKIPYTKGSLGPEGPPQSPYPTAPPAYTQTSPGYADNNRMAAQTVGEDGEFKLFDFTEQSIRKGFIRKVYAILMTQLLISLSFISVFLFCKPVKKWAVENITMFYIAFVVYFAMALSMICCGDLRRKAPVNYIFLLIFTLATSYMLGLMTSFFDVDTVMIAVGITAAVVLALTLFAFQTKYDFTVMGGGLLCALVILILFGCICAFIPGRTLDILYSSAGALIFSLYIVYDTQLMLGGKHKYSITPEEYIFAALNLYLDVINLFIRILSLIGRR